MFNNFLKIINIIFFNKSFNIIEEIQLIIFLSNKFMSFIEFKMF